jgi:hypothetical protein
MYDNCFNLLTHCSICFFSFKLCYDNNAITDLKLRGDAKFPYTASQW